MVQDKVKGLISEMLCSYIVLKGCVQMQEVKHTHIDNNRIRVCAHRYLQT